jgi:hypothetical protein
MWNISLIKPIILILRPLGTKEIPLSMAAGSKNCPWGIKKTNKNSVFRRLMARGNDLSGVCFTDVYGRIK